jgi:osmotically inducible lipoprotein OsmB
MKKITILVLAILLVSIIGCADMTPTQQRTVTGGLGGAAGGAAIGAIAGNAGMGALIGGAAGSTGGFLYGRSRDAQDRAFQEGLRQGRSSR